MPISFNSLFPLFLFMLLRRLGPAYSDHLHYPKQICFEVLRFCKKKDPLIPHEKMFKAHKFTGTDVHYHWICLFPPLCSFIGNRLPHVLLILQRLASSLYRSQHPAVPIHTSKLFAYLLETKHRGHIMAASHFPIFKSISLRLASGITETGFISIQKDHSL